MTPLREIVEELLFYAGWPRKERWLAELQVLRAKLNAAKAEIERLQNDSQQT